MQISPLRRPALLDTPEFQLLTACAYYDTLNWSEQCQKVEAALDLHPDAIKFKKLIDRHRLPAIVATVLTRVADESGRDLLSLIDSNSTRQVGMRNLAFHAELTRVKQLFDTQHISLLPLKGTTLSQRIYGNIGMRQMKDIDVLVKPNDLSAAIAVLEKAGYEIELPLALRGEEQRPLVSKTWWHIECIHPSKGIMIELHWRFERIENTAIDQLWWHWMDLNPETDGRLYCAYEFLYLCLHGASHGWSRLKWLGDVHVIANRFDSADWALISELAARLRMETILEQVKLLLQDLFGASLISRLNPPQLVSKMEVIELVNFALESISNELNNLMDGRHGLVIYLRNQLKQHQINVLAGKRYTAAENIRYWLRYICFTPVDLMRWQLAPKWHWLYALIRPLSLVQRLWARGMKKMSLHTFDGISETGVEKH